MSTNDFGVAALEQFKKTIRSFALFHFAFIGILAFEALTFLYLVNSYPKTLLIALTLSLIFLTVFTYLVFHYYFQTKKPGELFRIKENFTQKLKEEITTKGNDIHLLLASSSYKLSSHLNHQEYQTYKSPINSPTLRLLLKKVSFFCHWKDVHLMKELLLLDAIDEHVKLIKKEPTNLEAHASLANAYIALSRLYKEPNERSSPEERKWKRRYFAREEMRAKFKQIAHRAIEELKILDEYSPDVPWVYAQLASCYHDLGLTDDEIAAYEKIHGLSPKDDEILYRLGVLYFQKGENAKGLRVYDKLKTHSNSKALDLIDHYAKTT